MHRHVPLQLEFARWHDLFCSIGLFHPYHPKKRDTLRQSNMAMEDGPFLSDFPNKTSIQRGFSSQPCLITRGYDLGEFGPSRAKSMHRFPGFRISMVWVMCSSRRGRTTLPVQVHLGLKWRGEADRRNIGRGCFNRKCLVHTNYIL